MAQTMPPRPVAYPFRPFASGHVVLMVFAVLLLINHLGRPFEHVLVGLRIPAVICTLGILVAIAGGLPAFKTNVGLVFAALIGWMLLITPLSTWKGGSVTYILSFFQFWLILFMILACAPKTLNQLKWLASVTALATVVNIIIAGRFNNENRFEMEGTFGNSDDAAILAGFAIPFWLFMTSRLNVFVRLIVGAAGAIFLLRVLVQTGTRSVIISMVCMFLVWFFRTTTLNRFVGVIVLALAIMGIVATTSTVVIDRLATTLSAFSGSDRPSDEASQSAAERRELMKDGLWTTLTHPIWGVGPGQFGQYRWSTLSKPDKPKTWFKTHNTYLELSADNGIPGVLIYLVFIWVTYKAIRRVRNATAAQTSPNLRMAFQLASCLELALVFFAVTALFMTVEGHPYMFILAGLAIAAERLVQVELRRAQPAPLVAPFPAARSLIGAR
ncbi:MAG TPA: O-antigen ligase family protein [Bryobacteraceae bacterium]|nr:O-antigen ligase family protein [Bryobacteraceae bacterium]